MSNALFSYVHLTFQGVGVIIAARTAQTMIVEMGGTIDGRNHEQVFTYVISTEY